MAHRPLASILILSAAVVAALPVRGHQNQPLRPGVWDETAKVIKKGGTDFGATEEFIWPLKRVGASDSSLTAFPAAKPPKRQVTQEDVLQCVTAVLLAQIVSVYIDDVLQQSKWLLDTVTPIATHIPVANYSSNPDLKDALEGFVAHHPAFLYAAVVNNQARGMSAQARDFNSGLDVPRKSIAAAFTAGQRGEEFRSDPIMVPNSGQNELVMVIWEPITQKDQFLGMLAAVVTLKAITKQLADVNERSGLEAYVVDHIGHLVASYDAEKVPGVDMAAIPIVQKFLGSLGRIPSPETSTFPMHDGDRIVTMLGTYISISTGKLGWGVIVQRRALH